MINHDGELAADHVPVLTHDNRGLKYGDALFETLRCVGGTLFFWEDHYFRLMASMRILRMEIPMDFTMERLASEIKRTVVANGLEKASVRVRLTVFRKDGGLYGPRTNDVSFLIETSPMESPFYLLGEGHYEVELYKDFYIGMDMLSNLKTNNKALHVLASIYAKENGYDNCLLINTDRRVVEAINGNIFLVQGQVVKTPPLEEGCLDGIIRKKVIEIVKGTEGLELQEVRISTFELQGSDEMFLTNSMVGIQSVGKYRKKEFGRDLARSLVGKLNARARMSPTN